MRKKKVKLAKKLSLEYHAKRIDDLNYYIHRSRLNVYQIAEALDIPRQWVFLAQTGRYKRPCDERISLTIKFIKDFERLQSYYQALSTQIGASLTAQKNRRRID